EAGATGGVAGPPAGWTGASTGAVWAAVSRPLSFRCRAQARGGVRLRYGDQVGGLRGAFRQPPVAARFEGAAGERRRGVGQAAGDGDQPLLRALTGRFQTPLGLLGLGLAFGDPRIPLREGQAGSG